MENHLCHAHKYFLKNVLDPINNRPFFLPQGILGGGQRLLGEVYLLLVARQNAVIREHLFRIGERNPEGRYRSLRIFGGLPLPWQRLPRRQVPALSARSPSGLTR